MSDAGDTGFKDLRTARVFVTHITLSEVFAMDNTRFYSPSLLNKSSVSWEPPQFFEMATELANKCISRQPYQATSLYVGTLGPSAYLRYRLAKYVQVALDRKDEAERYLLDALAVVERDISQHEHHDDRRRSRVSLLEGKWVGAKALECAILYQLKRSNEANQRLAELLEVLGEVCQRLPPTECEVLYGRSGSIQAVLFLRQELNNQSIGKDLVIKLASEIMREGQTCSTRSSSTLPLMWQWHDKAYLGAAHGVVGICQTLLSLQSDELDTVDQNLNMNSRQLIRQTIDGLEEFCFASGNLQSSIGSSSSQDKLVHWCHGAPGHVLLLVKASSVFGNPVYLERAKEIGENVLMQRGILRKGVGLCHGISGNAYALLSIGRATEDPKWIQQAKAFAQFAWDHLNELETIPDHPYSLYEGCAGLAILLLDLCNPEQSAFPLYEFM